MDRICIFGADGRTGVEVVTQALDFGYEVIAFVYSANAREHLPSGITIIQGDILNANDVDHAVAQADAIISVVGHIKGSDPLMQTKGMENIVHAMERHGLRRIVSLTGTGVRQIGDKIPLLDRIGNIFIRLIDPDRVKDGIKHVEVLRKSNLEWTVLRVLKLGNGPINKHYYLTEHGPAEKLSSRKRVALMLVDILDMPEWIHKMPISSPM